MAILGATGLVGQRFVELLQGHPWFEIEVIAASERSVDKKYRETCNWKLDSEMPAEIGEMIVSSCNIKAVEKAGNVDFIFSGLPGSIAGPIEEQFAAMCPVISKASAHRMKSDVPLLIPEVNPSHLRLIPIQKEDRNWDGFICTDPNCSTIQLVMTLKPLMRFGLTKVIASTMQALSGAGYPGVPSLSAIDNVIPFIPGEEEKIESETLKLLGKFKDKMVQPAKFQLSASCNRVTVRDGHLQTVFVELENKPSMEEVLKAFEQFNGEPQKLQLPTAPSNPIIVKKEKDRPQPNLDRNLENGMCTIVGRVREDPVFTLKYLCLGHNTIRGAAGAGILSAELLAKKGYF